MVESDHNILFCKLKVKWDRRIKIERKEVFRLKYAEGLKTFSELTSNCPKLVKLSKNSSNFLEDAEKWLNKIEDIKHKSFQKIRITGKAKSQNEELDNLMKAKLNLKSSLSKIVDPVILGNIKEKIKVIENEISLRCSEKNVSIVKHHIEELSNGEDQVCRLNMWRLKNKLCPRNSDPPMAKKNSDGFLVSDPDSLKQLYVETYKQRLKHRIMRPGYEDLEHLKSFLFNIRLSLSKRIKSEPWTPSQLMKVLKSLKAGKSCDALGYTNEMFKPEVIGSDLFESLLNIVNRAKDEISIPRPVRLTKITSIYKNKGEKCDLKNDRGVHSVTKFRAIMDKLLYNDKYDEIDSNMSNCNVGGRRNRSIRDNLFIINAVINDALLYQKIEIDFQFYDLSQAFDSQWYEETMNDMWESMNVRDDKFAMISEMNKEVDIFVKTPVGDSEVFTMKKIEQQGTGLGPIKCSNQIDSISRECLSDNVQI